MNRDLFLKFTVHNSTGKENSSGWACPDCRRNLCNLPWTAPAALHCPQEQNQFKLKWTCPQVQQHPHFPVLPFFHLLPSWLCLFLQLSKEAEEDHSNSVPDWTRGRWRREIGSYWILISFQWHQMTPGNHNPSQMYLPVNPIVFNRSYFQVNVHGIVALRN